jgi:hypothetical protein
MQMGWFCDELAQPFLEKLASTTWLGQDDVDPPVPGRTVESASHQGAYYVMLNILAERGIIAFRKGYAAHPNPAMPATRYFWFRLTKFGGAFRGYPAPLRRTFLAIAWLMRWDPWRKFVSLIRRVVGVATLPVTAYKIQHAAWADVVIAIGVFVAIFSSSRLPPSPLAETLDT